MRKYLIGIFIGVALTISSSVFAEDIKSLIGQKIQGEFSVKINGKELAKPAIVIDGTSYLPNRAIADALGMNIKFDADLGIELTNKEVPMTTPEPSLTQKMEPMATETNYNIGYIESRIEMSKASIWNYKASIEAEPGSSKLEEWKNKLKANEEELTIWEVRKAALANTPTSTP